MNKDKCPKFTRRKRRRKHSDVLVRLLSNSISTSECLVGEKKGEKHVVCWRIEDRLPFGRGHGAQMREKVSDEKSLWNFLSVNRFSTNFFSAIFFLQAIFLRNIFLQNIFLRKISCEILSAKCFSANNMQF